MKTIPLSFHRFLYGQDRKFWQGRIGMLETQASEDFRVSVEHARQHGVTIFSLAISLMLNTILFFGSVSIFSVDPGIRMPIKLLSGVVFSLGGFLAGGRLVYLLIKGY